MQIMISLSALAPSQYRKYVKGWDKGRYAEAFGGKYRVYIPLNKKSGDKLQAPIDISHELLKHGYTVEDYLAGIAVDSTGKRRMKIGKLLSKSPTLQKMFNEDKSRAAYKGKHIICISRHPYDIAGMSTGRGWTSCMNLDTGINKHYVEEEINVGSLIAYIIEEKDLNIKSPVSRISIKPFERDDGTGKPILVAGFSVYGTEIPGFIKSVQTWLDQNVNMHRTTGLYRRALDTYNDGESDHMVIDPNNKEEVDRLLDLNVKNETIRINHAERDLVLSAYPHLLKDRKLVYINDLVSVLRSAEPELAMEYLIANPERVLSMYSVHSNIVKGSEEYRRELRRFANIQPTLFPMSDKEMPYTPLELAEFVQYMPEGLKYIDKSRIDLYTFKLMLEKSNVLNIPLLMPYAPKEIPSDVEARIREYPRLIFNEKPPTAKLVKLALDSVKGDSIKDSEWKLIIFAMPVVSMTYDIIVVIQDWLREQKKHVETKIRFTSNVLGSDSPSPEAGNVQLAIRCLKDCEEEHIRFNVHNNIALQMLFKVIPPELRIERFATGMYTNVLTHALESDSFQLSKDEATILAEQNVDQIIYATEKALIKLAITYPTIISAAIQKLIKMDTAVVLRRRDICNIDYPDFWKEYFLRLPDEAVADLTRMVKRSDVFCDFLPPVEFRWEGYWRLLEAYTVKPWTIANDRYFMGDLSRIPAKVRELIIATDIDNPDIEEYKDVVVDLVERLKWYEKDNL